MAGPNAVGLPLDLPPIMPLPSNTRGKALALVMLGSLLFLGTGAGLAYFCFFSGKAGQPDGEQQATRDGSGGENGAGAATATGGRPQRGHSREPLVSLPEDEQKDVDKAIERGAAWLKQQAKPAGSWSDGNWRIGYSAMPALTLLMCGVPASDPVIQNAAKFVRDTAPRLPSTYELSLAILFLDQLGDAQDRDTIKTLALRLVAGQGPSGAWTYNCPVMSAEDSLKLVQVLQDLRSQESSVDIACAMVGDKLLIKRPGEGPTDGDSKLVLKRPDKAETLPPALGGLPVLQEQKLGAAFGSGGAYDHSNTQFAMLALWVAGR